MKNTFEVSILLSKSPKEVWNHFFDEISNWWTADFYTNSKTKFFNIEIELGGKMYEDFGNGEGLVWGEVIGIDKFNTLTIKGNLSGAFGGPAISFDTFRFSAVEGGTNLQLQSEFIGNVSESSIASLEKGWKSIFQDYFKNYAEKS